jgi:hypothetical protein
MDRSNTYPQKSNYSSSNKDGFNAKVGRIEKNAFGNRISATGYTEDLIGMDDVDRLRKIKLNNQINGK